MFRARACSLTIVCALAIAAVGCGHRNTTRVPQTPARTPKQTASRAPKQTPAPPVPAEVGTTESGIASWYGNPYHGRRAASGEVYDMEQLTAAHRTLPFQTWVEVTNLDNGKQVGVRITDRGPFVDGRVIDLSLAAARELDMVRAGVVPVRLRVIDPPPVTHEEHRDVTAAESPAEQSAVEQTFAVQAGAFSDQSRAEAFRDSLPFPDARIVSRAGDPPLWRVLVGTSLNMDAAAALAENIRKATGEAFVVQER